jgi:hypothetical protein
MGTVVVTGSRGFISRNLVATLGLLPDLEILTFDRASGLGARIVPEPWGIPPGYTHSITNTGSTELVTLFWASEPFDPGRPDTHALPV